MNLQFIADKLGLSRSTVSLALRNDPRVAATTRALVRSTAEELGYRPNPMVSALMSYHRAHRAVPEAQTLALINDFERRRGWDRWFIFREIERGARLRSQTLGYKLEEFWLHEKGMTERRMSQSLQARGIRGVFVMPLMRDAGTLDFDWSRFAAVGVGFTLREPRIHVAECNLFQGMMLAFGRLRALGYHRIGLATPDYDDERVAHLWLGAFLAAQHALPAAERVPPLLCPGSEWSRERFLAWREQHRPEAVLSVQSDVMAWLTDSGLRVPEHIGFGQLNAPPEALVAGLNQHGDALGTLAVETLVALIERNEIGLPVRPHNLLVEASWQDGPTVRARPPA